jgi:ABC-type glycerol-3-phosphate transport system substrate-binding protein
MSGSVGRRISRTRFVRALGGLAGAAVGLPLLAACQSAPPTATSAPKPTAAAAPTAPAAAPTAPAAAPTAAAPAAAPTAAPPTAAPAAAATKPAAAATAPAARPAGAKEPVTLRFHMRAGGDKSEPAIYVDRPGEWSQETGHKVKLEPIPGGTDYIPKIQALAASNTIGDLTWTSDLYCEHTRLVKFNVLEPVDDYLGPANVKKSEWFPSFMDPLVQNGKTYGLPKGGSPGVMYIWLNDRLFDKAGLKPPQSAASFEDLSSWAGRLAQGPKDRRDVYGYFTDLASLTSFTVGIRAQGVDVLNKEGTASLADGDGWFEWAKLNNQWINVDRVHPTADAVPSGGSTALFVAEKLAMLQSGRWTHFQLKTAVKDQFPYRVIEYPKRSGALPWGMAVDTHSGTATSKHKQETFSLLYALADQRFAYLVGKTQGYLTGRTDNLEALKELADDPFMKLQWKTTSEAGAHWRAKNLRHYEFEAELKNQMDLLWQGKRQLDRAFMADLKKALDGVLAKPE